MSNPLKDIFSSNTPEYKGTLYFADATHRKIFEDALEKLYESGENVEIEGISKIEMFAQTGDLKQKIQAAENISQFKIYPHKENKPLKISTDYGDYTFNFVSYQTKSTLILETNSDSIFHIKISDNIDTQNINLTYNFKLRQAKNLDELIILFNAIEHLFKFLFGDKNEEIMIQIENLSRTGRLWQLMKEVEQEFDVIFNPKDFSDEPETFLANEKTIYELYYLFTKKQLLKRNINEFSAEVTMQSEKDEIKVGQQMAFTYVEEIEKEVFGKTVCYSTQNLIPYSTVSKFELTERKTTKLVLTGTDSKPMYIVYRAYKTIEEIQDILDLNTIKFEDAKLLTELIEKRWRQI